MSNLSTLPKGDSAWLLRKAIERIIQQVSVLETNIGASTSGNSADTQIIFNDNGTLRGDAGLVYNKTTDALTAGAATITGDLTVDTSTLKVDSANNRVGIGTASPAVPFHVQGSARIGDDATYYWTIGSYNGESYLNSTTANPITFYVNGAERYRIGNTGISTWSVAGTTAMTLNSTGLGIGINPSAKIHIANASMLIDTLSSQNKPSIILGSAGANFGQIQNDGTGLWSLGYGASAAALGTPVLSWNSSGNVGIGVTPATAVAGNTKLQITGSNNAAVVLGTNSVNASARNWAVISNWNAFGDLVFQQSNALGGDPIASGAGTTRMTLDASGRLLVGSSASGSSAGDGIVKLGVYGFCISQSGALIASGSSVDLAINTSGAGYQGFLSIANTQNATADIRTQTTYSVFGRGTSATFTQIATANGSLGGASFTVTTPSNGVIRITNTSGLIANISVQFFGGASA